MAKAYQYNASGYYVGEIAEDYGLLPNNATYTAPALQEGFVPRWTGAAWEQVEDHRGKQGYVDGQPYTVKDYGPLPAGWSDTPPPPTHAEALSTAYSRIQAARDARMNEGGLIWQSWLVSIDKEATDRMTSTAVQFQAGFLQSVRWKMSDGEYAELDQAGFFGMAVATEAVVQLCYGVEEAKRAAVEALPDAPAVLAWLDDAANLLTGWPDEYGQVVVS